MRLWEILSFEAVFIYLRNFFKCLTKIWLQIIKVSSVKRIFEVNFKISSQNLPTAFAQAETQFMYPYIYSECNIYALFTFLMCATYCARLLLLDQIIRMEPILGLDLNSFFRVGDQVLRPYERVSIIKNWKNFVLNKSRTSTERSGEEQILASVSNRPRTLMSSDRQLRRYTHTYI